MTFVRATFLYKSFKMQNFIPNLTWILCQAQNGNLLASNDIYPEMGGIWLSEDGGETWEETQADQYAYSSNLILKLGLLASILILF